MNWPFADNLVVRTNADLLGEFGEQPLPKLTGRSTS
jgi:hypothetical protein